ncbi:MAG: hypothetical protein WBI20_13515 [Burkholderiaceae bacterium]
MKYAAYLAHQPASTPMRLARQPQAGYVTLSIAVILLIILSLMTVYLSRSGIIDIRTSANKTRYAQALTTAERNLEIGLAWISLSANRATLTPAAWVLCNDGTLASYKAAALGATWRCLPKTSNYTDGVTTTTVTFVIATPADALANGKTYTLVAEGLSSDGSANAVVKQGVFFYSVNGGAGAAPPLMGSGNIPLNGTFSVVTNPNSGGQGVPVSVWSKITVPTPSGSSATCQIQEYNQNGDCSTAAISSSLGKGKDIVENDATGFPSDVFQFIFGIPAASYQTVKSQATQVANCSNLNGLKGIVWVAAECTIPSGTTVGSTSDPVVLVVESGNFTMSANSTFYGLLFAFGPTGPSFNAGDIKTNGGATFYGSIISNDSVDMGLNINGTFNMIYSKDVMGAIYSPTNNQFKVMAKIPGSWADYL